MTSTAAPAPAPFSRTIPLIVGTAAFMEMLDGTVVNTALPTMAAAFGTTPLGMSIGITVYLVAMASFIPAAGWFAERFGARTVFASAVALFTLASLACGLAPTLPAFIAARLLQGTAAAFMSPVGRIVVLEVTPTERLLQAIGTLTWPALIAPVVGPVVGGALIAVASWRWIFLLNVPLGVAGVALVLRFIPRRPPGERKPFDVVGFLLTGTALAAGIVGLTQVGERDASTVRSVALIAAGAVLGLLALRHARRAPAPILSLAATRVPSYHHASLGTGFAARVVNVTSPFLIPLMFQLAFGLSALHAGTLVLAYMAGNLLVKTITIPTIERFGYRRVLVVNGVLCAASMAACGLLDPAHSVVLVDATLFVAGASRSMHLGAITTMAFVDVTPAQRAGASALATMLMQLSTAVAVAGATAALSFSRFLRGGQTLVLADFRHVWFLMAAVMLGCALAALRLAVPAARQAPRAASAQ